MNVLYAIQGTGNGHVSRAKEIGPVLEKYCRVDYLLSGRQVDLVLPFEVTYRTKGLSFYFGKNGGVDILKTFSRNYPSGILREIRDLPIGKYDLVVNDFEPISAWAARKKGVRCVSVSHQCALTQAESPMPSYKDPVGLAVLHHYAPAAESYGFHFRRFNERMYTPVIRNDLRNAHPANHGHYTVYLPAYDDRKIIEVLRMTGHIRWEVFSKNARNTSRIGNITISPVHDRKFALSMLTCAGVLCGAGFETPSEALYLGKKLMVIPMTNQFEQHCNAEALHEMGIPVLKSFKKKSARKIFKWVTEGLASKQEYPDQITEIVESILSNQK